MGKFRNLNGFSLYNTYEMKKIASKNVWLWFLCGPIGPLGIDLPNFFKNHVEGFPKKETAKLLSKARQ